MAAVSWCVRKGTGQPRIKFQIVKIMHEEQLFDKLVNAAERSRQTHWTSVLDGVGYAFWKMHAASAARPLPGA